MPYDAERRKRDRESMKRMKGATESPLRSTGGGGFESAMPAGQPTERTGLVGKGLSDAEIRALHEAAGNPRTDKTKFGVNY